MTDRTMSRLGLLLFVIAQISCTIQSQDNNNNNQQSSPAVPVLSKDALQKLLQSYFPTATLTSADDGYSTSCEETGAGEQCDHPPHPAQPPETTSLPATRFPPQQQSQGVTPQAYQNEETAQRPYHRRNENNQNEYQRPQNDVHRPPQYGQRGMQGLDKQTIVQSLQRIYQNQGQEKGVQSQQQSAGPSPPPFNPRVSPHQRPQSMSPHQQDGPNPYYGYQRVAAPGQTDPQTQESTRRTVRVVQGGMRVVEVPSANPSEQSQQ